MVDMVGYIYTRHDNYIHGHDGRRVLFKYVTGISAHTDYQSRPPAHAMEECFIHGALYIKQINERLQLDDYTETDSVIVDVNQFKRNENKLAGFVPFMSCLRQFILNRDEADETHLKHVDWKGLYLDQIYTTSVAENEMVLFHCIMRSTKTKQAGDRVICDWNAHKSRWLKDESNKLGNISPITHLVDIDGIKKPFLLGEQYVDKGIVLDADSTCTHGTSSSQQLEKLHVGLYNDSRGITMHTYELRLEVKFKLPAGFSIVNAVSQADVTKRLHENPLVACRYVNDEWFVGEVVSTTQDGRSHVIYATYSPEYTFDENKDAKLAFANYKKDWVFVETRDVHIGNC
jgi:hypothetical protein